MVNLMMGVPRNFSENKYSGVLEPDDLAPTTKQVIGTYVEDAFLGDLTLNQLQEADKLKQYEQQGEPLDEIRWKNSEFYREGLEWRDGMTTVSAQFLAYKKDDEDARTEIMSKATGWQSAAGIATAFGAGVFEPLNLGAGLATFGIGTVAGRIGYVGRTLKNLSRYGKYTPGLVKGAIESVAGAGIAEAVTLEAREGLQSDYDTADSLFNFATSLTLGAGLNIAPMAFKDVKNFVSRKVYDRQMTKLEGVTQQLLAGKKPDVKITEDLFDIQNHRSSIETLRSEVGDIEMTALRKIEELKAQKEVYDPDLLNLLTERQAKITELNKQKTPLSLMEFLHKQGGLQDYAGELKNLGIDSKARPGLISKNGMDLDMAGLRAFEAGYFNERPTVAQLLEAIDEDYRFKNKYSDSNIGDAEYINELQLYLDDVDRELSRFDFNDDAAFFKELSQKADINKNIDEAIARIETETANKVEGIKSKIKDYQDVSTDSLYSDEDLYQDPQFFNGAEEVDISGRLEDLEAARTELEAAGLITDEEARYFEQLGAIKEDDLTAAFRAAEACLTRG